MDDDNLLLGESLRGLKEVCVVVEDVISHAQRNGVSRSQLQTMAETKLRKAGIRVLSREDAKTPGSPYFYVNVNAMNTDIGLYAYATSVALKQEVVIPREPFVVTYAATWEIGGVGTVGVNNLRGILESVGSHIDRFCSDYLAVNPGNCFQ